MIFLLQSNTPFIQFATSTLEFLITEDKDFGELIFSYGFKDISIILLRYDQPQYDQIENFLLKTLEEYSSRKGHFFITITKKKIRIREI